MWDFRLLHDHRLRSHPAFEESGIVLGELFDQQKVSPEFCTEAMRREINRVGMKRTADLLVSAEKKCEFERVESLFKVISCASECAVVDKD